MLPAFLGGQISVAFVNIVTIDINFYARMMNATIWKVCCSVFEGVFFPYKCHNI
jgi:hypothetical protein